MTIRNPRRWPVVVGDVTIPAAERRDDGVTVPGTAKIDVKAAGDRVVATLRAWAAKGELEIVGG